MDTKQNQAVHDRKQMDHLIIFQLQVTHWGQKSASHLSFHFTAVLLIINKYIISFMQHFITTRKIKTYPHRICVPCMGLQEGRMLAPTRAAEGWACVSRGCGRQDMGTANGLQVGLFTVGKFPSQIDEVKLSRLCVSQQQMPMANYHPDC